MTASASFLIDTGIFILFLRKNQEAVNFLRTTDVTLYYARITRKELLHPPISAREREEVITLLQQFRLVNPDPQIAEGFSSLLDRYIYLKDHLADALIAATAWKKNFEVITTNARHFDPITEINVRRFPEAFRSEA